MKFYSDTPWLKATYSDEEKRTTLSMLSGLNINESDTVHSTLTGIAKTVFNLDRLKLTSVNSPAELEKMNQFKKNDFLMLAIIICLAEVEGHVERLIELMKLWRKDFNVDERIKLILEALIKDDRKFIMRQDILGEAYQNQAARENGIKQLGWFDYKKQMNSMTKGRELPALKEKFAFMNDLPENTLGGQLCHLLRNNKLSLPGEKFGFAEFFLWHDLSHLLSGNDQDFPGELGANTFTAAFSRRGKFKILLFGLLQWNLGHTLAIVAKPATDQFKKPGVIDIYLQSLISGCFTIFDLLEWPTEVMIEDLKRDINAVRRKYNIIPIKPTSCDAEK